MELKKKLCYLRKKQGFSQMRLAEILNVSRQAVSRWEQGSSTPSIENLVSLGKLYNTPVDVLVDDNMPLLPDGAQSNDALKSVPPVIMGKAEHWSLLKRAIIVIVFAVVGLVAISMFAYHMVSVSKKEEIITWGELKQEEVDNSLIEGFTIQKGDIEH